MAGAFDPVLGPNPALPVPPPDELLALPEAGPMPIQSPPMEMGGMEPEMPMEGGDALQALASIPAAQPGDDPNRPLSPGERAQMEMALRSLDNGSRLNLPMGTALDADYRVKLSPTERDKIGRVLKESLERFDEAFTNRRENAKEWMRAASMYPPGMAREGWQSDIRIPFTATACNKHTIQLNQGIVAPHPPFIAVPKDPEYADYADEFQEAMLSLAEEADWAQMARQLHKFLPVDCPCAVRVDWEERFEQRPGFYAQLDLDAFQALMEGGLKPDQAFAEAVVRGEDGQAVLEFGHREVLAYSGVRFRIVKPNDLVWLPASAGDPDQLFAVGNRLVMNGGDLLDGARNRVYWKDAVDKLLKRPSDEVSEERQESMELGGIDVLSYGEDALGETGKGEPNPIFREYRLVDFSVLATFDRTKARKWYVVTIDEETGSLLRCSYLPYPHGQCNYVLFPYGDNWYEVTGMSVAELAAGLQAGGDALLNSLIDMVQQAACQLGNFLYDSRSGYDPDAQEMAPGVPVFVENADVGIRGMDWAKDFITGIAPTLNALALLKDYCDILTGTSNVALGRETSGDKTLGEVQLVLGQAQENESDLISGTALRHMKVLDQVRWLYAGYRVEEDADGRGVVRYRKSGQASGSSGSQAEFRSLPVEVLTGAFDLVPAGMREWSDSQSRLQRSLFIHNMLTEHPLVASLGPDLLLKPIEDVLTQAKVPWRDRFMADLEERIAQQLEMQAQQAQQQELMALAQASQAETEADRQGLERETKEGEKAEREQARMEQQAQREQQAASQAPFQQMDGAVRSLRNVAGLAGDLQKLSQGSDSGGAGGRSRSRRRRGKKE